MPRSLDVIATAPLSPGTTALLLIDAQQEHFIPGGPHEVPDARAALGNAAALLERARTVGAHVVHVRHVGDHPLFEDFREGSPGFAIRPEVAPAVGEPVIDKRAPSAFEGTPLEDELAGRSVEAVVVAGFTSPTCCTATALAALARRYRTVVAADATASDPHGSERHDEVHARALTVQRRLGAEVLSSHTIGSLLGAGG
jgi:nicotinamidase-related amidase